MKLSNVNLLEMDAAILVGLLIFLTFQSFVAPIYDQQFNLMLSDARDLSIERDMVENHLIQNCEFTDKTVKSLYNDVSERDMKFFASVLMDKTLNHPYMENMSPDDGEPPFDCNEWKYRLYEIHFERYANEQWIDELDISFFNLTSGATFDQFFSTVVFFSTGAKMISVLATVIMIIPFALSAIIIVFNSIRVANNTEILDNEDKQITSKWASVLVIIGLVFLIVGFSFLMLLTTCATFPSLDCFGVSLGMQQPH